MRRTWLTVLAVLVMAWCSTGCAVSYHTNGFTFAVKDKTETTTLFEVKVSKTDIDVKGDPAQAGVAIAQEVNEFMGILSVLGF